MKKHPEINPDVYPSLKDHKKRKPPKGGFPKIRLV